MKKEKTYGLNAASRQIGICKAISAVGDDAHIGPYMTAFSLVCAFPKGESCFNIHQ